MSKKELELTGEDLAYDIMESDITIADMDVEGIMLTEDARGGMQGMDGGEYGVRDDQHGDGAKDNLPMREHELGQGEVAMTKDLIAKLLGAVLAQSPDEAMLETICMGLVNAGNKEDRTLDVADIGMIMGEIKAANSGGDAGSEGDAELDQAMGSEEEPAGDMEEEETCEGCGQYEDQAKGDKKEPEGGAERHKEKEYQLMDQEGDDELEEAEGGSKPISDNSSKGKGPGGGSADEYGQKASDDIIPEYPDGNDDGVPGKPLDNVTPPPGSGKSGKPVSEAWMAAVPGVFIGSGDPNDPEIEADDPDAELKMIKRRAGMPEWWKV